MIIADTSGEETIYKQELLSSSDRSDISKIVSDISAANYHPGLVVDSGVYRLYVHTNKDGMESIDKIIESNASQGEMRLRKLDQKLRSFRRTDSKAIHHSGFAPIEWTGDYD